jgi:hypothetical protein
MFDPLALGIVSHVEIRRADLVREAEKERLARRAAAATENKALFGRKVLATVGRRLSHLGAQLQERYGRVEPSAMPLTLERAAREQR